MTNFVDAPATTMSAALMSPTPTPATLPCTPATRGTPRTRRSIAGWRNDSVSRRYGPRLSRSSAKAQVAAAAEAGAGAREQHRPHRGVVADGERDVEQLAREPDVDAVRDVGPVEHHVRHP